MGPNLIIDKSTFQGLSAAEHSLLGVLFKQGLPPVLGYEIIADLAKKSTGRRRMKKPPKEKVQELARKFHGSGPVVVVDYRTACLGNLNGTRVPMTGQLPVGHGTRHDHEDGSWGLMIDLHPINRAIMRWSAGHFLTPEQVFAEGWRNQYKGLKPEAFRQRLHQERLVSRRVEHPSELRAAVDAVFDLDGHQQIWLEWLLDQLRVGTGRKAAIMGRWTLAGEPHLREYAPYAAHCVRSMLALDIAVRSRLLKWNSTHIYDLQYLFYQPFCMVFASTDNLHRLLSPVLKRRNQDFLDGAVLKIELAALNAADVGIGPSRVQGELTPGQAAFKAAAPTIFQMHQDHLWGGAKGARPTDSID